MLFIHFAVMLLIYPCLLFCNLCSEQLFMILIRYTELCLNKIFYFTLLFFLRFLPSFRYFFPLAIFLWMSGIGRFFHGIVGMFVIWILITMTVDKQRWTFKFTLLIAVICLIGFFWRKWQIWLVGKNSNYNEFVFSSVFLPYFAVLSVSPSFPLKKIPNSSEFWLNSLKPALKHFHLIQS